MSTNSKQLKRKLDDRNSDKNKKREEQTTEENKKDDLVIDLYSISGKKRRVNFNKPFFGGCNNVDMYRKISRIGEGTYGIGINLNFYIYLYIISFVLYISYKAM